MPNVALAALLHKPPQQSLFVAPMSPFCPQYDGCAQMPFAQSVEQHWLPDVHALPSVLHDVLSAAHFPLVHVPLQH